MRQQIWSFHLLKTVSNVWFNVNSLCLTAINLDSNKNLNTDWEIERKINCMYNKMYSACADFDAVIM